MIISVVIIIMLFKKEMHSRDKIACYDLILCTAPAFSIYYGSLLYLKIPNFLVYLVVNFF